MIQQGPLRPLFSFSGPKTPSLFLKIDTATPFTISQTRNTNTHIYLHKWGKLRLDNLDDLPKAIINNRSKMWDKELYSKELSLYCITSLISESIIYPNTNHYSHVSCKSACSLLRCGKICWRRERLPTPVFLGFPCGSAGKASACNAGDLGWIPGLGRSPGEGKGYPVQYFGLENSMDCVVREFTKSRIQLSDFHFQCVLLTYIFCALSRTLISVRKVQNNCF